MFSVAAFDWQYRGYLHVPSQIAPATAAVRKGLPQELICAALQGSYATRPGAQIEIC